MMKKIALILAVLLLMTAFAACTDNDGEGTTPPSSSPAGDSTPEDTENEPDDTPAVPSDTDEAPETPHIQDESNTTSPESLPEQPETNDEGYIELPRVDF